MKTLSIQQEIISRYRTLSKSSKIPYEKNSSVVYLWGLKSNLGNKTGSIVELGNVSIETNKKTKTGNFLNDVVINIYNAVAKNFDTEIQIKGNEIQKVKKPLFASWSKTLSKINNMLKYTAENLDNKNIVEMNQLGLLCFSEKAVKRIYEINAKLARNKF